MSKGVRLPPPGVCRSTKVAAAILFGIVLAGLAVPWFPSPAGWILFVVVIYVGIPMLLMVVNDLIKLRQDRMLVRNLEVFPPSPEDPDLWVDIKFAPLSLEHVVRWRRWFPWLLAMLGMMLLAGLAHQPWSPAAIVCLCLIGFGREILLGVNVLRWMVPATWMQLTTAEQVRLRLWLLLMAIVTGAIAFGVVGIVYFLFFVSGEPWRWNQFAFAGFYGLLVWPCGRACIHFCRQALRHIPPDERKSERPV